MLGTRIAWPAASVGGQTTAPRAQERFQHSPTAEAVTRWLAQPIAEVLEARHGPVWLTHYRCEATLPDGPDVLLARDATARACGVVLLSVPTAPHMVQRAIGRARRAKVTLSAPVGAHVLGPLADGYVQNLSYAIFPFCLQLSRHRPLAWIHRALLRPVVTAWLREVTRCSRIEVSSPRVAECFAAALEHMANLGFVSQRLRGTAKQAAERLASGKWVPRHVLMHGDLWSGNILIRPADIADGHRSWCNRFVVIDWAGSESNGYAVFDLVRFAYSMGLSTAALRREVAQHCRLLGCDLTDARSYLMAALGHVAMHLECFPPQRFACMAETTLQVLQQAVSA